ncbi:MAG: CvpA family protein [Clostridia bacterium]|nr:CvpA family protein [Clostridia bacterium]
MSIAADIIIVFIIAGFLISGWRLGFFKILPGIVNIAAALIAAWALCDIAAQLFPLHDNKTVAKILAFIILFVIMIFVVKIFRFLMDKICRNKILKAPNKLLGVIIGLLLGVFYAWSFSNILGSAEPWLSRLFPEIFTGDLVENSMILKMFYNFNPLTAINLLKQ